MAFRLCVALLLGCSSRPTAPQNTAEPEAVVEAPEVVDTPEAAATSPEVLETPDVPEGRNDRLIAALQRLSEIMQATKAAAREAAEAEPGDECAKGYASMHGGIAGANAAFAADPLEGRTAAPSWEVAPRPEYLRLCRGLSEELQRCSRLDLRTTRSTGCPAIVAAASEEETAIMQRMSHPVSGEDAAH